MINCKYAYVIIYTFLELWMVNIQNIDVLPTLVTFLLYIIDISALPLKLALRIDLLAML